MASESKKILVCGDVNGNIETVFNRIKKLKKKGNNFDLLFCIGDFFNVNNAEEWMKYKSGESVAPISTFILGPNSTETNQFYELGSENGFEFAENITFLGKKGKYKDSTGLCIAYLSGMQSVDEKTSLHTFQKTDVKSLVSSLRSEDFCGVDILLTSSWPLGVTKYGNIPPEPKFAQCGSKLIAQLALAVKPRYHFSALEGVHYERVPYRNHVVLNETAKHVTRFISLAPVDNPQKQKFMYAFSITPMNSMKLSELVKQPPDVTECPYFNQSDEGDMQTNKRLFADEEDAPQFRWSLNHGVDDRRGMKRKSSNHDTNQPYKKTERPQDWKCWFCLGGDKVEKHLVASVGNLTYVAMAKGGITAGHVLILPIAHHPCSLDIPDDTSIEIDMYKAAIKAALAANEQQCVIFERNFRSDHMQLQIIPVAKTISTSAIKQCFIDSGAANCDRNGRPNPIDFAQLDKETQLKQLVGAESAFFHVELPDGTRLLHKISSYFPLQFGRDVMASEGILNTPDRAHWRDCIIPQQEEVKCTQEFRDVFKAFDFTLKDEDADE